VQNDCQRTLPNVRRAARTSQHAGKSEETEQEATTSYDKTWRTEPAVGSEAEARGRGGLGCHVHHATQPCNTRHTHTHLLQEASEVLLDLPNDHTGVSVPQHHSAHLLAMQSAIEKLGTTKMTMPAVAIACCVQRKK